MEAIDIFFLTHGFNQDDMVISNHGNTFIRNKDLFIAGYTAKNEQIQKRIDEITAEIKELTDGSMKTSFKLTALRATKKELKALLS